MRPTLWRVIAAAGLLLSSATQAQTVLLHDDFNSENDGHGSGVYGGFTHFWAADVDLLGPGYFFHLCQVAGHDSACVDMQGNGNGTLTSRDAFALAPGQVTLQFDLAGDQRGYSAKSITTRLIDGLGHSLFSETITLAPDAPFSSYTRTIALDTPATAYLQFESSGLADSYGLLLDNVTLSVSAVPESPPAVLLAAGLGVLMQLARRRGAGRQAGR